MQRRRNPERSEKLRICRTGIRVEEGGLEQKSRELDPDPAKILLTAREVLRCGREVLTKKNPYNQGGEKWAWGGKGGGAWSWKTSHRPRRRRASKKA